MTHSVVIALASNQDQEDHLHEAQQRLGHLLTVHRFTEAIWTDPIRATRPCRYLNQLLYAETEMTCDELEQALKQMEREMGRTPEDREKGIVPIDLDLMRYDDQRYHLPDWERDYIKKLL